MPTSREVRSRNPSARRRSQVTECSVEETELYGDYGPVLGIQATCMRCGHVTESFGTSDASIRRCLALMRQECPRQDARFYVEARS